MLALEALLHYVKYLVSWEIHHQKSLYVPPSNDSNSLL